MYTRTLPVAFFYFEAVEKKNLFDSHSRGYVKHFWKGLRPLHRYRKPHRNCLRSLLSQADFEEDLILCNLQNFCSSTLAANKSGLAYFADRTLDDVNKLPETSARYQTAFRRYEITFFKYKTVQLLDSVYPGIALNRKLAAYSAAVYCSFIQKSCDDHSIFLFADEFRKLISTALPILRWNLAKASAIMIS